jgi:hypothetical protein
VTNYRRNFICGGSFFFTANPAERRLRLLVDDFDTANNRARSSKDDGFRCRSTHPTGCRSLSSVESVSAAITFNSRHLSTCRWTRALFRPRRVCGREAADYAGAYHPPAPKFAALIFLVLLELP